MRKANCANKKIYFQGKEKWISEVDKDKNPEAPYVLFVDNVPKTFTWGTKCSRKFYQFYQL